MSDAAPAPGPPEPSRPRSPRWPVLFNTSTDAVFVLNHRRRLLFANPAWEVLAGVASSAVYGLLCRRPRPAAAGDPPEQLLAHALTPPPEVLQGHSARTRRLLPGREPSRRWWDVEFLPLRLSNEDGFLILGRVRPVPAETLPAGAPIPERLVALRDRVARRHGLDLLAGTSPMVRRLVEQVRLAARVTTPALLVGEAGSGKRTVARVIHFLSAGRERGFAALDCARLPLIAIHAVLFGERSTTLGTIYLAEPDALPRDVQLRLCETLARRAADPHESGPRYLAGTRADPAAAVAAGRLLDELRCTLSPLLLEVPPLRRRLDDLPTFNDRLLACQTERSGRPVVSLTPAAIELLRGHDWPGNLRELSRLLTSAARRAKDGRIDASDFPARLRLARKVAEMPYAPKARPLPLDQVLESAERRLIELALRRCDGNRTRAAAMLGIWRPRLIRRMAALGMNTAEDDKEEKQTPPETPP